MIDADHLEAAINTVALGRFLRGAQKQVGLAGEVNVLITSSQQMRRLNREFRGKNKPTDVLSFPSSLNGKSKIAGDIAISGQIARANAESLGHPVESELKVLLLHGLLHLAGFDHESDHGRMARREQQLRAKLGLPTGLIERSVVGKGTSLAVPSRLRDDRASCSQKSVAQRERSGKKEGLPAVASKALRSGLRRKNLRSSSPSSARAKPSLEAKPTAAARAPRKSIRRKGTSKALGFPQADSLFSVVKLPAGRGHA